MIYKSIFKRLFDYLTASVALIILSPIFIIVPVVILLDSGLPILYKQIRVGYHGKYFMLYKFRTMTNVDRKVRSEIFDNNSEVTRIGKILRRYKIDELPQLLNVLLGQMSIVGPRPSLPDLTESYNDDGKHRILVKPGLTGLAQINGNIYLSWEERWKFDKIYVANVSFSLDIKIILKTLVVVIFGENKFLNRNA